MVVVRSVAELHKVASPPIDDSRPSNTRVTDLLAAIDAAGDAGAAEQLARYFQVRPGGYGEGDTFVGVKLSELRRLVRPYVREPLAVNELAGALQSQVHEHRLAAVVLIAEYAKRALRSGDEQGRQEAYELFLAKTARIDNWDLVDAGTGPIVGGYLLDRPRDVLYSLIESSSVWDRRIALVATHRFIRAGQSADTYALTKLVLDDGHDLIDKAAGWMLREAGKRVDEAELRGFLDEHANRMPRTMLRYAIEGLPTEVRRSYLAVKPAKPRKRAEPSRSGRSSAGAPDN